MYLFCFVILCSFYLQLCLFFARFNCVVSALHRSESRNSLISNGGGGYSRTPASGVSIAGMGTNRRPSTTPTNQRQTAKGPSRRGSVTYITQENNSGKIVPITLLLKLILFFNFGVSTPFVSYLLKVFLVL